MRSRNYTKEIGIDVAQRPVPVAASTGVIALVIVCALLFARQVSTIKHTSPEPAPVPVKVSSR